MLSVICTANENRYEYACINKNFCLRPKKRYVFTDTILSYPIPQHWDKNNPEIMSQSTTVFVNYISKHSDLQVCNVYLNKKTATKHKRIMYYCKYLVSAMEMLTICINETVCTSSKQKNKKKQQKFIYQPNFFPVGNGKHTYLFFY